MPSNAALRAIVSHSCGLNALPGPVEPLEWRRRRANRDALVGFSRTKRPGYRYKSQSIRPGPRTSSGTQSGGNPANDVREKLTKIGQIVAAEAPVKCRSLRTRAAPGGGDVRRHQRREVAGIAGDVDGRSPWHRGPCRHLQRTRFRFSGSNTGLQGSGWSQQCMLSYLPYGTQICLPPGPIRIS